MGIGIVRLERRRATARLPLGRQMWVLAHRWAGLTLAGFLIVAGATGSLLPFEEQLELAGRPSLAVAAPPRPGAAVLDGVTLAERVEAQTSGRVIYADLDPPADRVMRVRVSPRPGGPRLGYDTVWVDPYSGAVRLRYRFGALSDGPQNIMPFLFLLHYSLALGAWGQLAFGVAALVWVIDCFVGLILTLPLPRRLAGDPPAGEPPLRAGRGWWRRWKPAFGLRLGAGRRKLTFDLHRVGGLWAWPLLLVFAWSSLGFNLPQVHQPVMRAFGAAGFYSPPLLPKPLDHPPISRREAVARGAALMAQVGRERGFAVERGSGLYYLPSSGAYLYAARTSLDVVEHGGRTQMAFSGADGRILRFTPPTGATPADAFSDWLNWLHMAQVFGLPYRILVSAIGLAVTMLSVTGVLIWMRKRSARLLKRGRAREARPAPPPTAPVAEGSAPQALARAEAPGLGSG